MQQRWSRLLSFIRAAHPFLLLSFSTGAPRTLPRTPEIGSSSRSSSSSSSVGSSIYRHAHTYIISITPLPLGWGSLSPRIGAALTHTRALAGPRTSCRSTRAPGGEKKARRRRRKRRGGGERERKEEVAGALSPLAGCSCARGGEACTRHFGELWRASVERRAEETPQEPLRRERARVSAALVGGERPRASIRRRRLERGRETEREERRGREEGERRVVDSARARRPLSALYIYSTRCACVYVSLSLSLYVRVKCLLFSHSLFCSARLSRLGARDCRARACVFMFASASASCCCCCCCCSARKAPRGWTRAPLLSLLLFASLSFSRLLRRRISAQWPFFLLSLGRRSLRLLSSIFRSAPESARKRRIIGTRG